MSVLRHEDIIVRKTWIKGLWLTKNSIPLNASPYKTCVVHFLLCITKAINKLLYRPIISYTIMVYQYTSWAYQLFPMANNISYYSHSVVYLTLLTSISWPMHCRTICNFHLTSCANISFCTTIQNYLSNIAHCYNWLKLH